MALLESNYIIDQGTNFSSTVTVKIVKHVALNLTGYTTTANMALDLCVNTNKNSVDY